MKRFFKCMVAFVAVVFLLAAGRAQAAVDWSDKCITVIGTGVANPALVRVPAQGQMLARRAAIADAYRQLAEMVQGVQVDATTTVENMMTTSDIVKTKVSALIKGAQVINERAVEGGGYEVTMRMPLFGNGGLSTAVLAPPPVVEPFPEPPPEVIPSMPAYSKTGGTVASAVLRGGKNSPMAAIGGFTGLIIDCRGIGTLNPVISPVVKNVKGVKLYGHNLNSDLIITDGVLTYEQDSSQAGRAGSNPLVIKAVRLEDLSANPVVSEEDGSRILIENGATGFLNKAAVVFLY